MDVYRGFPSFGAVGGRRDERLTNERSSGGLRNEGARCGIPSTWRNPITPRPEGNMPAKINHIQVSGVAPAPATLPGLPSGRGVIALVEVDGMPHLAPGPPTQIRVPACPRHPGDLPVRRGHALVLDRCERRTPARGAAGAALKRSMETLITRMEDRRRATPDVYGVEAAGVVVSFRRSTRVAPCRLSCSSVSLGPVRE